MGFPRLAVAVASALVAVGASPLPSPASAPIAVAERPPVAKAATLGQPASSPIVLSFQEEQDEPPAQPEAPGGPAKPQSKNPPAEPVKEKAETGDKSEDKEKKQPWFSIHGQGTIVSQGNWKFTSPYEGPNSLLPLLSYRTTETATLYLDGRLWEGGDIVFNPEISGGRGLSSTLGVAGFPNGEATRVGVPEPTPYVARLFFRQTFNLGGAWERLEDAPNQLPGHRDYYHVTFALGKMSATDVIDNNRYSHDPRTQFLDWALMFNGAWDYPANARGYTYGATAEFATYFYIIRYGVFAEPTVANGTDFDPHFLKANGHIVELEERLELFGRPGRLREWAYLNHAHMGNYREALAEMPVNPDITQTRAYRIKYGFGANLEQELARDLGLFVKVGWNDGQSESWAFTEIDATAAAGLQLKGRAWRRPQDETGLAVVVNGLSPAHRDYLAAGGLGFIIGDGRLNYGLEKIVEVYYNAELRKGINVTADFEAVENPAYNRDRGPVAILAIRVHFEY